MPSPMEFGVDHGSLLQHQGMGLLVGETISLPEVINHHGRRTGDTCDAMDEGDAPCDEGVGLGSRDPGSAVVSQWQCQVGEPRMDRCALAE